MSGTDFSTDPSATGGSLIEAGTTPAVGPGQSQAFSIPQLPWRGWQTSALLLAGGAVAIDGLGHLLQPGSGWLLGLGALAGGFWMLSPKPSGGGAKPARSLAELSERCEALIPRFSALQGHGAGEGPRREQLRALQSEARRPELQLALVGVGGSAPEPDGTLPERLAQALRCRHALRLQIGMPLGSRSQDWQWPEGPAAADALVFHLRTPLGAAELRWLEAIPAEQPVWLLVSLGAGADAESVRADLLQQWPAADADRLLLWDSEAQGLEQAVAPLATWLNQNGEALRARTARRRLEALHASWQAELERLRRGEWQQLQLRTQWVVAAGVLVAPLPSLDLLVLAVANGLMLREMARLWDCPWTLEQLRAAASELARVALAQGVVEWSSQALASAVKLHGATWLVGGALQALSAAYLTRVVGRAMADVLALSAGVSEPDLARIRMEAPLLVARAAEQEKLDWAAFIRQGRHWWEGQQVQANLS